MHIEIRLERKLVMNMPQCTVRFLLLLAALTVAIGGCTTEITPTRAISDLSITKAAPDAVAQEHFVTKWLVLGPFSFEADDFGGDQQQPAADKAFVADEAALDGTQLFDKGPAWVEKQFPANAGFVGRVNLDRFFEQVEHAAAYAVAWVYCPERISGAALLTGSDDYLKVWINSKLVHTYKTERRAGEADQDKIENITLKKGYNRIVVKCVDVVLGWNFCLRFADKDGRPIAVKAR